jgi:hypothetical protein
VTINGTPARARFRFASRPRTRVDGIVASLPTAALPKGEKVISGGMLSAFRPDR